MRHTTIDTVTVTYDALGRMVEQTSAGVSTEREYSPTGFLIALLKGQSEVKLFMPFPGGTEQVWQTGGGASPYYRHSDWLGGSRFASTQSRTMYNDLAYARFGETYAQAGSTGVTNISFAGNDENTVANLYDAQFRQYGIQGRWPSADPAGIAAAEPANPQSWNRYAYVLNNPLSFVDPFGLWCVWQDGTHDADPEDGGDGVDQCLQDGGMWDASDTITGCDSSWTCSTSYGPAITNGCPPDSFSCVGGPNTSVVVNGSNDPNSGGYGTGSPPAGCAFYYMDGIFLGTSCGNGPVQNTPQSAQLANAVAQGTSLAGHVIPAICGGGGFIYGGPHFENQAETRGLAPAAGFVEWDTQTGLGIGTVSEGNIGIIGGGVVRENGKTEPLVFAGEFLGSIAFGNSVGVWFGARTAGVGAYVNITPVLGCH